MRSEANQAGMLEIAGLAAQIILENGAETYRVEDTVQRLCASYGHTGNVLALSTGVLISIAGPEGLSTVIRRVPKRSLNLSRVNAVNELSRLAAEGRVSPADTLRELRRIQTSEALSALSMAFLAGGSAGSFALMFGGGFYEFAAAFVCGMGAQTVGHLFRRADISLVLVSLVGGLLCSFLTMGAYHLFPLTPAGVETTLSGAIMPLISGLMMTNAMRDTLRGDLISGLARSVEALLVAVMVAVGISLVLRFYLPGEQSAAALQPPFYLSVLLAGSATLCFCPLIKVPSRAVVPASLLGMAAYGAFLLLQGLPGMDDTLALFAASAAVALLCELLARRMRMISTVFLCAALIPLVPGLGLYRTMHELLLSQYESALALGLQTIFAVGAIALGAAVGSLRPRPEGVKRSA